MNVGIRPTAESDLQDISRIYTEAFEGEEGGMVAHLTENLLKDPTAGPYLSLLALHGEQAVGHILFTHVDIGGSRIKASLLAPLAVLPEFQSRGIGGRLIREGLDRLAASGTELVFVLGHSDYYPRFGFAPAGIHGLEAPYPIPEKHAGAWMALELKEGILGTVKGRIKCAEALDRPEYWAE